MSKNAEWVKRMLLMFFGLTAIKATCNKAGVDCTKVTNRFEISAKVTPDYDTIKAGDSLVLEISESTSFIDVNTGQSINFSNAANLGTAIGFQRYDSLARFWHDAAESFRFYLVKGKSTPSLNELLFREYLFAETNNRYLFKLILVPRQKGLFRLVFSNSSNTYRKNDPCPKANFAINLKETSHNRGLVGPADESIPGGDFYFIVN